MITAIAIVPSIALLVYIYVKDRREKEPLKLLLGCFIAGAITSIPAIILEMLEGAIFDEFMIPGSIEYGFVDAFIVAGISEELFKYLFLKRKTWKSTHFDCTFDGIVYAVFVSLGFATLENIMYVFDGGLGTAVLRMFTAIPGHTCFAVYMGYYYSKAKQAFVNDNKWSYRHYIKKAFWVPVLIHGIYDFPLMLEEQVVGEGLLIAAISLWFVFDAILFFCTFRFVNKASRDDDYLKTEEGI